MLTTFSGMEVPAVALPTDPEIATLAFPVAIALDVVKKIVAPPEGTLIGNVAVVDNPAGSVPSVIAGVAVVPDSCAVTVTKNASFAAIVAEAGFTLRDNATVCNGGAVDPPPPPQPFITNVEAARIRPAASIGHSAFRRKCIRYRQTKFAISR
jgi:hypothetical protein